jgi:hypothetical protein
VTDQTWARPQALNFSVFAAEDQGRQPQRTAKEDLYSLLLAKTLFVTSARAAGSEQGSGKDSLVIKARSEGGHHMVAGWVVHLSWAYAEANPQCRHCELVLERDVPAAHDALEAVIEEHPAAVADIDIADIAVRASCL